MKPYLLIFREIKFSRFEITDYLDSLEEVLDWYAYFANAIFLISELQSNELAALLKEKFNGLDFLVTEIPLNNKQGMLSEEIWFFINHPETQIEFKSKGNGALPNNQDLEFKNVTDKFKDNKEPIINLLNSFLEFFKRSKNK